MNWRKLWLVGRTWSYLFVYVADQSRCSLALLASLVPRLLQSHQLDTAMESKQKPSRDCKLIPLSIQSLNLVTSQTVQVIYSPRVWRHIHCHVHGDSDRQTDRQAERRTDRVTDGRHKLQRRRGCRDPNPQSLTCRAPSMCWTDPQ